MLIDSTIDVVANAKQIWRSKPSDRNSHRRSAAQATMASAATPANTIRSRSDRLREAPAVGGVGIEHGHPEHDGDAHRRHAATVAHGRQTMTEFVNRLETEDRDGINLQPFEA